MVEAIYLNLQVRENDKVFHEGENYKVVQNINNGVVQNVKVIFAFKRIAIIKGHKAVLDFKKIPHVNRTVLYFKIDKKVQVNDLKKLKLQKDDTVNFVIV